MTENLFCEKCLRPKERCKCNNMRVFLINGADYICAKNMQEAENYYKKNICDIEEKVEEVDTSLVKMMYPVDAYSLPDISEFTAKHKSEKFECGYDNKEGNFVIWLKLSEVIEIDKQKEPYVICSTEQ